MFYTNKHSKILLLHQYLKFATAFLNFCLFNHIQCISYSYCQYTCYHWILDIWCRNEKCLINFLIDANEHLVIILFCLRWYQCWYYIDIVHVRIKTDWLLYKVITIWFYAWIVYFHISIKAISPSVQIDSILYIFHFVFK